MNSAFIFKALKDKMHERMKKIKKLNYKRAARDVG